MFTLDQKKLLDDLQIPFEDNVTDSFLEDNFGIHHSDHGCRRLVLKPDSAVTEVVLDVDAANFRPCFVCFNPAYLFGVDAGLLYQVQATLASDAAIALRIATLNRIEGVAPQEFLDLCGNDSLLEKTVFKIKNPYLQKHTLFMYVEVISRYQECVAQINQAVELRRMLFSQAVTNARKKPAVLLGGWSLQAFNSCIKLYCELIVSDNKSLALARKQVLKSLRDILFHSYKISLTVEEQKELTDATVAAAVTSNISSFGHIFQNFLNDFETEFTELEADLHTGPRFLGLYDLYNPEESESSMANRRVHLLHWFSAGSDGNQSLVHLSPTQLTYVSSLGILPSEQSNVSFTAATASLAGRLWEEHWSEDDGAASLKSIISLIESLEN